MLNINYSNIKQYCRGERTMSSDLFNRLMELSPHKDYWRDKFQELDANWGFVKGGKTAAQSKDNKKRLAHARKFRNIISVDITPDETFCEFYGLLLGDGCITKYPNERKFIRFGMIITCNKNLDSDYLKNWKIVLKEKYGLNPYYYEQNGKNMCYLSINNKKLCLDLNKQYGVPIGPKYEKIHLSRKILDLPWNYKKYVLRGLFDTDGLIFARKDEDYRYPHISITSKSQRFLKQLIKLLREQNYPAYLNGEDMRIKGIKNVKRWFSDIGSSNKRNIDRYEFFLKNNYLPPRNTGLWSNG